MSYTDKFFSELEKEKKKRKQLEYSGSLYSPSSNSSINDSFPIRTTVSDDKDDFTSRFFKELEKLESEKQSQSTTNRSSLLFDDEEEKEKEKQKWYQGWFDKGAFADGYQFGDISKTILGTVDDIGENVTSAVVDATENLIDTVTYGSTRFAKTLGLASDENVEKINAFIAKDQLNHDKTGEKIYQGAAWGSPVGMLSKALLKGDTEKYSVLGDKMDGVVQSGAHLAGSIGLSFVGVPTWLTMGVNAFGGQLEEAGSKGATFDEAGISAAVSAAGEVLSEYLFGGLASKTGLDDVITKPIANKISNKLVKGIMKYTGKTVGEGFEEIVSEAATKLGEKLTFESEKSWQEVFASEEAADEYITSFISGMILGGAGQSIEVAGAKSKGVDYVSGLTSNEEAVVNKLFDDRVAEMEKSGKVSLKDKNAAYDEIVEQMKKGEISTDTIEEVLGGETYKTYKDTIDSEDARQAEYDKLKAEYDTLHKTKPGDITLGEQLDGTERLAELKKQLPELKKQLEEMQNNSQRNQLKTKLSEEVSALVAKDRLSNSYYEKAMRKQAFEADLKKYNEKQRVIVKAAIDSGVLNNTRRTHELVDLVAKLSADKGVLFDFTNNAKLKESGFAIDGKTINGFVKDGKITLNTQSAKYLNSVVGHEITHILEGTELYTELQNTVIEYAKTKGDYQGRLDALNQLYKDVKSADINAELTADLVGDYLFTDADFINNLSTKNRNLFQKVYDEIKYLYKVATAGSKEARELEKVKKVFEKAYRENIQGKADTTNGSAMFSYSRPNFNKEEWSMVNRRKHSEFDNPKFDLDTDTKWMYFNEKGSTVFAVYSKHDTEDPTILYGTRGKKAESDYANLSAFLRGEHNVEHSRTKPSRGTLNELLADIKRTKRNESASISSSQGGEPAVGNVQLPFGESGRNGRGNPGNGAQNSIELTEYNEEASDNSGASFITFSNDYSAIRNFMKDGDVSEGDQQTKYSLSDSTGRQLSNEQAEYFKDSAVRDENGNLMVLYHGTQNDFTVFDVSRSGENYEGGWSEYGEGIYLTPDKKTAEYYGDNAGWGREVKTMEVYANIKNLFNVNDPVDFDISDLTKKYELTEFDERHIKQYGNRLVEFLQHHKESVRDYLTSKGYDGVWEKGLNGDVYQVVAYAENQIKNTDNAKPTADPDIRYSLSEDSTAQKVNESMTMQEAKQMIARAFVLGDVYNWYDGKYKNGDEWLRGEGAEDVAMIIENEYSLQSAYLDKMPGLLNEEYFLTDVLEAYSAGTLTGKVKKKAEQISLADGVAVADKRFYAPKEIENAKYLYEVANQRMSDSNREEVTKARAAILLYAHNKGAAETIGITNSELNKKLRAWGGYSAKAREISMRINSAAHPSNRWSGIESVSWLNKSTVSNDEVARMVKSVEGDADSYQTKYIARTMLSLDTHIDWSWLNFKFDTYSGVNSSSTSGKCNGYYRNDNRLIHVKRDAPNTVAHEMGHALDYQWGRDLGYSYALTEVSRNTDRLSGEAKVWFDHFNDFKDSLVASSDIRSEYSMDVKETFARFVSKFVEWTEQIGTGKSSGYESSWYNDKFTGAQFVQFARLLQEKSAIDAKGLTGNKFSLSNIGDTPKKYGNLAISGKDIALETAEEEIAPIQETAEQTVQEDVAPVTETAQEAAVPVSETKSWRELARTVRPPEFNGDSWSEDYLRHYESIKSSVANASVDEVIRDAEAGMSSAELLAKSQAAIREYEQLQAEKPYEEPYTEAETILMPALYNQYSLYKTIARNPAFVDELKKAVEDTPVREDILPDDYAPMAEDDADFQERLASLDEADMPPEMDALYPGEPTTTPDPFADRDMNEVGNRKVKAYMYENPEVKPFFQEAARVMLGDLGSSVRGERWMNGEVYYNSGGEKGWYGTKRQTTADIADLLDNWNYSYDQIEQGLKDIIEDNGKENNAVSKRIEFMLDDRLRNGYKDVWGEPMPANPDYINLLKEKQINEYSKEAFDSFMQSADRYAPPVEEDTAPVAQSKTIPNRVVTNNADNIRTFDSRDTNAPEGQQAMWEEPAATDIPKTRKALHQSIIDNAKNVFSSRGFDLDSVFKKAKDLSTFATVDNTPQRVMEKALGYKEGGILADLTVNKVAQNETEGIKWLNSFTDKKNGLLAQISKQYNIKPGSKASAAAQMYAEGFYVDDQNNIIQYGDAELAKDFPNATVQRNIKGLARDQRIRRIYDETLAAINASRTRNAYPEIPRLDNYFLHFRAMDDTFSRLGLPFNPNDIRAKDLPTDLNGVTADLKPGQPYFASAMHRKGKRTSFDLLGGLERYLTSAKNQIYHIDDIQTLRALRNYVADTYGQANGLEGLDELSEEAAQERIEQVYNSHLSTFAKFLNEEANVLAGKTALIDRGLEGIIGRRGITLLDTINKQVGSNMVGFNVSSSLTNILPVVQTFAKTNKADFVKAFGQTAANKVGSIFGRTDSFTEDSPVVIRRKGADRFYRTPYQKIGDTGYILMSAVDDISTELIARTKYNELTRKGMDSQKAHYETDKWVSRLMGDRSLGQQPHLYNSKMLGLFTKFQLEVRNQLDSQFYDTIQEAKVSNEDIQNGLARNAKTAAKVTSTFVQLAIAQHLFGKAFESVAGYNPAFDIISAIVKLFGFDDEEESEDTVLDNVGQAFFELMGDMPYVSTLTGGRIPISAALPIKELYSGKDQYGNEKSRWETLKEAAPYYVLPTGYGQLKKTHQGLSVFDDDLPIAGSYTDSGNLRFPVEDTLGNRVQAGIFGQWSSQNARDYFDNERTPLNKKQTNELVDLDMPFQDYLEYREGLKEQDTLEDKFDYIAGLDVSVEQKNIMINNIVDRKEDVDMSNYDDFGSYEEFNFYSNNTAKYNFLQENGISYETYTFSEQGKEYYDNIYSWYKNNPEKVTVSKAVTDNVIKYRRYQGELDALRADKDSNGKSISGSRKEKVIDYINNLDADYGAKIILFKSEYPADDTYNQEIIDYLNSRDDISYSDMETILKELGFTVTADGDVYWD